MFRKKKANKLNLEALECRLAPAVSLMSDINATPENSFPSNFEVIGKTLYFAANDGLNGMELWKSDGTANGTVLVKDIYPGSQGSMQQQPEKNQSTLNRLTNVGGNILFTADNGTNGQELWKSDGTASGTVLVKDINPGPAGSNPRNLINVNGICFFVTLQPTAVVFAGKGGSCPERT